MKALTLFLWTCLYINFATALKCFNCYIDGPSPFYFLKPLGPVWNRCTGFQDDYVKCEGVCAELMLYGNDISRYQVLRACGFGPEICESIEVGKYIHIARCRTCETDGCNDEYK